MPSASSAFDPDDLRPLSASAPAMAALFPDVHLLPAPPCFGNESLHYLPLKQTYPTREGLGKQTAEGGEVSGSWGQSKVFEKLL